jgi:riboflavin kinase/FMN adenylyltransferase
LLTTLEERLELLQGLGVDLVYVIDFTRQFSQQSAREFYQRNVIGEVGVSAVVVGEDHMFGRDRSAGNAELHAMGAEFGFAVCTVPACVVDGIRISSTRVRNALSDGDVAGAARFLGYPYRMQGRVIPGDDRGKGLGYPTANLAPLSEKKVIPARGVYVVRVGLEGEIWYGMMNIGTRPTVTDSGVCTIEVHMFDFKGNLYGQVLTVEFLSRLREERRFTSVGELVRQLSEDRERSKNVADAWKKSAE